MAASVPSHAAESSVPAVASLSFSRWCARLVLGMIALILAMQALPSGSPELLVGRAMPAGSAVVLGSLAAAVLAHRLT